MTKAMAPKSPQDSKVTMTEIVLPQHANALGTIFGGQLMSWIDVAAAIAARRHAKVVCVTASIDELHFLSPVRIGDVVNITAQVTAVHRTSCEILVHCCSESAQTQETKTIAKAFLTFVSVDEKLHPIPMPRLEIKTPQEKKLHAQAMLRRSERIKLKEKLEKEI